jgi:hypothetical protein
MSQRLAERAARALAPKLGRRSFLTKSAVVGSALAATPAKYILEPGTAYAAVCSCSGSTCDCGAACCDGYTEFYVVLGSFRLRAPLVPPVNDLLASLRIAPA